MDHGRPWHAGNQPLYTADERRRRDASRWTLVQGVLAPIQFVVFLVSLGLVLRYLATGDGLAAATASIVIKTLAALHHHDHRLDLGKGSLRALPVRAGLLLGRRGQHARAGAAHRLSGGADLRLPFASRADAVGPRRLCRLRDQRRPVPAQAARGPSPAEPLPPSPSALWDWPNEPRERPRWLRRRARPARARPARGVLRPHRHHLAAPQDPGRLLPRRRLAHLRPSDPVGRRRDDLRRAALRHRHHGRARPRRAGRRQRGAGPDRRPAARAAPRHQAPVPGRLLPVRGDQARPVARRRPPVADLFA